MDNGQWCCNVCCVVIYMKKGFCKRDGEVQKCVCGSQMNEVSK